MSIYLGSVVCFLFIPMLADNLGKIKVMNYLWFFTSLTCFLVVFTDDYFLILVLIIISSALSNGCTSIHFGVLFL